MSLKLTSFGSLPSDKGSWLRGIGERAASEEQKVVPEPPLSQAVSHGAMLRNRARKTLWTNGTFILNSGFVRFDFNIGRAENSIEEKLQKTLHLIPFNSQH